MRDRTSAPSGCAPQPDRAEEGPEALQQERPQAPEGLERQRLVWTEKHLPIVGSLQPRLAGQRAKLATLQAVEAKSQQDVEPG